MSVDSSWAREKGIDPTSKTNDNVTAENFRFTLLYLATDELSYLWFYQYPARNESRISINY